MTGFWCEHQRDRDHEACALCDTKDILDLRTALAAEKTAHAETKALLDGGLWVRFQHSQELLGAAIIERDDAITAFQEMQLNFVESDQAARAAVVREEAAAEHEMREVHRAFTKYGLDHLLVTAHGILSPHIAVLRLLAFLSEQDLDLQLKLAYKKPDG